jgi:uncharacterized protein (DUF305 family)
MAADRGRGPLRRARIGRIATSVVAAMSLAACRGGDEASTAPDASSGASSFDAADVEFVHGMIARHQQAIEMSEIALDPAAGPRPEIIDLATRIRGAAATEIEVLTGLLAAWGQPTETDLAQDHEEAATPGMMGLEDLDALASSTGADFDAMWLEMMSIHHRGAITVAQDVTAESTSPQVSALADAIVAAHQGDLAEMESLAG